MILAKSVTGHYKKSFTPDPSNQSQDILVTATRFEPLTTYFANEHSTI